MPIPGVSQRRRFTSVRAPVEDCDRTVVPLAQPRGELLGHDDGAVEATGAAQRDGQARLALADVGRHGEVEELLDHPEKATSHGLPEDVLADRVGQAGQPAKLGDVEGVLHEADVEHEVGLERQSVLVAEADQLDRQLVGPAHRSELREQPLAELAQRQVRGVDDDVGIGADRLQPPALLEDRAGDPGRRRADGGGGSPRSGGSARPRAPRGTRPAAGRDPPARRASRRARSARRRPARRRRSRPREALPIRCHEVGELGQQLGRQVVDDRVAEVLEELRGGGLAAARQAAEDDDVLFVGGRADRRFRAGCGSLVTCRCA